MTILYTVFWIAFFIIFYNYIGYGVLLWIVAGLKNIFRKSLPLYSDIINDEALPNVTLVVAAYNEAEVIETKIADCLQLDYPREKLDLLFVTDGSDDGTPDLVRKFPGIRLLHTPVRSGKTAALNRALNHVKTPITVFCDANTLLGKRSIRKIVSHYRDPETGGVSGEKRVFVRGNKTAVASEGLYWRYESFLKKLDAQLYTVIGAAGELFSIRTALWEPLEPEVILDDFVISLRINLKGYRMAYDPEAYAMELPSASMVEEGKRKVRIAAGAFQAMSLLRPVFNFFKYPVLFFQFFSHRFLRWTLTPLSIPLLVLSNLLIVFYDPANAFFLACLLAQVVFYLLALLGVYPKAKGGIFKLGKICRYILFMNYAVYLGLIRYLKGAHSVIWQKAEREMLIKESIN